MTGINQVLADPSLPIPRWREREKERERETPKEVEYKKKRKLEPPVGRFISRARGFLRPADTQNDRKRQQKHNDKKRRPADPEREKRRKEGVKNLPQSSTINMSEPTKEKRCSNHYTLFYTSLSTPWRAICAPSVSLPAVYRFEIYDDNPNHPPILFPPPFHIQYLLLLLPEMFSF